MEEREKRAFLGTGFHFPLEIDETTGRFRMSSEEENIKESIKLILMTRKRRAGDAAGIWLWSQTVYLRVDGLWDNGPDGAGNQICAGTLGTEDRGYRSVSNTRRREKCADDPDRIPGQGNKQSV